MKQVAVIILNWNGEKLLKQFLPSVIANTNSDIADVIVADNGSTDGSLSLLRNEFPQVKRLEFEENLGFAGGYNRAIKETGYRFTVLLNSDVETPPGWLEPLYDYMAANPAAGACQPKILSYNDQTRFEYAGAAGGFIDRNGFPYCRGRLFDKVETDNGQYDTIIPVFWATGAALMVDSSLYMKAGGLDEKFFAHMEEIDLCWRIWLGGRTIACVPQSHVYHLGGGSLPASNPRKTYLNFRNNLLLLHKNIPRADLTATLLRRRLLDTVAFIRFLAAFDIKNARAVVKAHNDFRRMRRAYTSHPSVNLLNPSRKEGAQPLQATPPSCRTNILTAFFLKGKKRYSQLIG